MGVRDNFAHTMRACYAGYVTQAIVNNFAPLLFLTFRRQYGLSLERVTLLVTLNFSVQLIVDLLASQFVDRVGYRLSIVAAHVFAAAGLVGLAVFPSVFADPYFGIVAAVASYAVGGGLLEVLVSPIVEACPSERKAAAMSLLHSFYCWGQVFVVLSSTLFFVTAGTDNWKYLACLWALLPLANAAYFCVVPIAPLVAEGESLPARGLLSSGVFWVLVVLMVCAGAAEQGMSQWASAFAEAGLGISKTAGDIAGPCLFAVMMGVARVFHARMSERFDVSRFMSVSAVLCVAAYVLSSLSPLHALALAGCALCGFSVGVMWPGTFSLAAVRCPRGGTQMFALLALAGDLGCAAGPTLVGFASTSFGGNLRTGFLSAIAFPLILLIALNFGRKKAAPSRR